MRPYNLMTKCDTCNIGVNDLVLVDARLTRWQCEEDGTTKYYGNWTNWRLGLELCAVSLWFQGPDEETAEITEAAAHSDFEF